MTALQVQAFGRLRLQHDGHVVTSFPTHHVEELLAYLLLNPQVRHSREKLITILWPESQPEKARGRFSTTLPPRPTSRLRVTGWPWFRPNPSRWTCTSLRSA
jgi:hypothetical protein